MSDQEVRPKRRTRKPGNKRPSLAHQTPPGGSRLARLSEIIASFPRRKVMVVGDFIADVYLYGKPFQLSREAPVVVIRHEWDNVVPGGAGNATYNLAHLGCRVYAVGMLGNDELGNKLTSYLKEKQVQVEGLVLSHIVNTTSKTRIMAGDDHTSKQQVIRIDRINREAVPARLQERLSEQFRRLAKAVDAIIVSDYGYGVVSGQIIADLHTLAKEKVVVVDSRHQLMRFRGVTAVTPNESEAEKATRLRLNGDQDVERAARVLRERLGLKAVLITRGNRGMTLLEKPAKATHIPIVGPDDIIDVTGAGDTVATVFTLALASGADFLEAATLANYAASIVVMKTGTAVATPSELMEVIKSNNEGSKNPA
jgi:D-glycero-beta-D-manno-heptose-7-phosphate kinase